MLYNIFAYVIKHVLSNPLQQLVFKDFYFLHVLNSFKYCYIYPLMEKVRKHQPKKFCWGI